MGSNLTRVSTVEALRAAVARARTAGQRIAFVPTMGALHAGHLSLFDEAKRHGQHVVASIFVNPLQFAPEEDLARYPRDLERDERLLAAAGVETLFAPTVEELYPGGEPTVRVVPGPLGERLCGAFRPGHFEGVLTVVAKLFNIVRPDVAVFGRKDFQQGVLVRRMVLELNFAIEVVLAPIVRDADGLALSSRNAYLSPVERATALSLWRGLCAAVAAFRSGERDGSRLVDACAAVVRSAGARIQYVELVDPESLERVESAGPGDVLAVAAFVGTTRLIDNLMLTEEER